MSLESQTNQTKAQQKEELSPHERMLELANFLAAGMPIPDILTKLKMSPRHLKRTLKSKAMKKVLQDQREVLALRRQLALELYEARRDLQLAAQLTEGTNLAEEAKIAKILRHRQEQSAMEPTISEDDISDDLAREIIRQEAEKSRGGHH